MLTKKLAACNSVDDNRLNEVKDDNSLYIYGQQTLVKVFM